MRGNVLNLPLMIGNRRSAYTGLAMGGPLDGVIISHQAPALTVAKVDSSSAFNRPLDTDEAAQAAFETVDYQYVPLMASNPPFGLFIASTLQADQNVEEPLLVTGVRELVKRYADTTPDKAAPAAQHPSRRH